MHRLKKIASVPYGLSANAVVAQRTDESEALTHWQKILLEKESDFIAIAEWNPPKKTRTERFLAWVFCKKIQTSPIEASISKIFTAANTEPKPMLPHTQRDELDHALTLQDATERTSAFNVILDRMPCEMRLVIFVLLKMAAVYAEKGNKMMRNWCYLTLFSEEPPLQIISNPSYRMPHKPPFVKALRKHPESLLCVDDVVRPQYSSLTSKLDEIVRRANANRKRTAVPVPLRVEHDDPPGITTHAAENRDCPCAPVTDPMPFSEAREREAPVTRPESKFEETVPVEDILQERKATPSDLLGVSMFASTIKSGDISMMSTIGMARTQRAHDLRLSQPRSRSVERRLSYSFTPQLCWGKGDMRLNDTVTSVRSFRSAKGDITAKMFQEAMGYVHTSLGTKKALLFQFFEQCIDLSRNSFSVQVLNNSLVYDKELTILALVDENCPERFKAYLPTGLLTSPSMALLIARDSRVRDFREAIIERFTRECMAMARYHCRETASEDGDEEAHAKPHIQNPYAAAIWLNRVHPDLIEASRLEATGIDMKMNHLFDCIPLAKQQPISVSHATRTAVATSARRSCASHRSSRLRTTAPIRISAHESDSMNSQMSKLIAATTIIEKDQSPLLKLELKSLKKQIKARSAPAADLRACVREIGSKWARIKEILEQSAAEPAVMGTDGTGASTAEPKRIRTLLNAVPEFVKPFIRQMDRYSEMVARRSIVRGPNSELQSMESHVLQLLTAASKMLKQFIASAQTKGTTRTIDPKTRIQLEILRLLRSKRG